MHRTILIQFHCEYAHLLHVERMQLIRVIMIIIVVFRIAEMGL